MSKQTIEILKRLVSFKTTPEESNLPLLDYVKDFLLSNGVSLDNILLFYDSSKTKANLFARIPAHHHQQEREEGGGEEDGSFLLSGHTDVVSVEGEEWRGDPFQLTEEQEGEERRLRGRGSADMKGFLAVCLSFVPLLTSRRLRRSVLLSFSYDEEMGCTGVERVTEYLRGRLDSGEEKISFFWVGEPTQHRLVLGHKGKRSYDVTFAGVGGHSSLAHLSVNAVDAAADFVANGVGSLLRRRKELGPWDPLFLPPYTSFNTGYVRGGKEVNIIPTECTVKFEFRSVPSDDQDQLEKELKDFTEQQEGELKRRDEKASISWKTTTAFPAFEMSADNDFVRLFEKIILSIPNVHANSAEEKGGNSDKEKVVDKVSFATEASRFQVIGLKGVVCGPGSIHQAHAPNEFISVHQLLCCEKLMSEVLEAVVFAEKTR